MFQRIYSKRYPALMMSCKLLTLVFLFCVSLLYFLATIRIFVSAMNSKSVVEHNIKKTNGFDEAENRGPDVIGIGIRKCGTGVVMQFLKQHGSFHFAHWENHETAFFTHRKRLGLKWYLDLFKHKPRNKCSIEKTPHYFYASPKTIPLDMLSVNPRVKIFLLLCDPVSRAYSCYVEHHLSQFKKGVAKVAFEMFVSHHLPDLQRTLSNLTRIGTQNYVLLKWSGQKECLIAGMYSLHMERWLKHFNKSRFLIIDGESLMKNPAAEFIRLQKFFGVPLRFRPQDWVKRNETGHFCLRPPNDRSSLYCQDNGVDKARTRSKSSEKPSSETTHALKKFYKPYNLKLFQILKQKFDW